MSSSVGWRVAGSLYVLLSRSLCVLVSTGLCIINMFSSGLGMGVLMSSGLFAEACVSSRLAVSRIEWLVACVF